MIGAINYHDWSGLQELFDYEAAKAGHPKGTLGYYSFSLSIPQASLDGTSIAEQFGEQCGRSIDSLISEAFKDK